MKSIEWIFLTIRLAYFTITVIAIHDGLTFIFGRHSTLAYLHGKTIYKYIWLKIKRAKLIFMITMLVYWFISDNSVMSFILELHIAWNISFSVWVVICINNLFDGWIGNNFYGNYVGILVSTRWLSFNELIIKYNQSFNASFS